MSEPNETSTLNAPSIVWQHGPLRIVAREEIACEEHDTSTPMLFLEIRETDFMDDERWVDGVKAIVDGPIERTFFIIDALMTALVAGVDVLPGWVREFVSAEFANLEDLETASNDDHGTN